MIYRSRFPDVEIPDVSLAEFVLRPALGRGDRPALIDGLTGAILTYAQLTDRVPRIAGGLAQAGLRKGDVVLICAPNRIEYALAFYAAAWLGAATTTMNPTLTAAEMRKQVADASPTFAFTVPELEQQVRGAAEGRLERVFLFGEAGFDELGRGTPAPPGAIDPAEDVVALPYSSGTSGAAKGVMLTHRNLVANLLIHDPPIEASCHDDVTLAALPFFHIYGLSMILTLGLYRGASLVVFPRFDMRAVLEAVERYRITRLPLVPPLVLRLARDPMVLEHDLSSLRVVVSGAAPLPPELAAEVSSRLHVMVKQGYGMTELSPGSHMHPEDIEPLTGTVGSLARNTECRLVDPVTLEDAPPGSPGEIWVRGPQVMKGYLGRPEETAAARTTDGWMRTGDIGTVDSAGNFSVVDRLKELIKYKGFQVAPAELEALLLTHPSVADVAVVRREDSEAGEIAKAYVVVRPGWATTAQDLMDWVSDRVAHFKRVRAVEFVDEIPRSPSGKILRRLLMERDLPPAPC